MENESTEIRSDTQEHISILQMIQNPIYPYWPPGLNLGT